MNDDMLSFVKSKLEETEGISSDALAHILDAAGEARSERRFLLWPRTAALLAASFAIAACGWFAVTDAANARREADLANVLALLNTADGGDFDATAPLSENLLAWQDAPTLDDPD